MATLKAALAKNRTLGGFGVERVPCDEKSLVICIILSCYRVSRPTLNGLKPTGDVAAGADLLNLDGLDNGADGRSDECCYPNWPGQRSVDHGWRTILHDPTAEKKTQYHFLRNLQLQCPEDYHRIDNQTEVGKSREPWGTLFISRSFDNLKIGSLTTLEIAEVAIPCSAIASTWMRLVP